MTDVKGPTAHQPMPVPNDRAAIADLVIDDLRERKRYGTSKYGTPLQAGNGRDPLVDAYQESIDKTQYLRQAIEERPLWDRLYAAAVRYLNDAHKIGAKKPSELDVAVHELQRSGVRLPVVDAAEPLAGTYNPIPLDLTDPRLAYLLDPKAHVDESVVIWEREYREKNGHLDGCTRCQNGLHWQCHGCSCPCSMVSLGIEDERFKSWVADVRAIGPYELLDPKERALVGDDA